MLTFVFAGPYPTTLDFRRAAIENPENRVSPETQNCDARALLNFMRQQAGRDVSVDQLVKETRQVRAEISEWFYQGSRVAGRSYQKDGIITERGKDIYRYEERPSPAIEQTDGSCVGSRSAEGNRGDSAEMRRVLCSRLSKLPSAEATVIVLRYLRNTPLSETAKIMKLTPSVVSELHYRALGMLKKPLVKKI